MKKRILASSCVSSAQISFHDQVDCKVHAHLTKSNPIITHTQNARTLFTNSVEHILSRQCNLQLHCNMHAHEGNLAQFYETRTA